MINFISATTSITVVVSEEGWRMLHSASGERSSIMMVNMGRSWQRAWAGLMSWQYPLTAGECTWWRHDAFRNDGPLLWESPVDSPHKGPAMWSLHAFRVGSPNEPYKQSSYWSFEIVWRPCDDTLMGLDSNNFFPVCHFCLTRNIRTFY